MSSSGPSEPTGQAVLASLLRGVLRGILKPRNRAGRPVAAQRRWLEKVARIARVPGSIRIAKGSLRGIPGEWVEAKTRRESSRTILYLHGGAYCIGSPLTHRALAGHLALVCKARVFVADYRLAPESPYPAAVEDAVSAYRGLLESGAEATDIAIVGDSAGGGLTLATALSLRDRELPLPSNLVVFSPWTDLSLEHLGAEPPGEAMLNRDWLDECARFYAGTASRYDPLISPVYAQLAGLPPTLVQVGSDELILSDAERLSAGIEAAGGRVRLSVFPRRWHVFQLHAGVLTDSDRALREVAEFLDATAPPC